MYQWERSIRLIGERLRLVQSFTLHCTDLDEEDQILVGKLNQRNGIFGLPFPKGRLPFEIKAYGTL